MPSTPLVSIIVPVKNGSKTLKSCLEHISQSIYQHFELIVVDDSSSDDSAVIASAFATRIYHTSSLPPPKPQTTNIQMSIGPAGARNLGSRNAKGEILFFVDCDVLIGSDAVGRAVQFLSLHSDYVAVFGSYDNSPAAKDLISQFRNLLHHFVHQTSNVEAETFWAGCGAIRKDAFYQVDGFNAKEFPIPSVEDIDLGYRLRDAGLRIYLDKGLSAKHLKCWTLKTMIITDIFHRAVPWLKLLNNRPSVSRDLNLQTSSRISGGLVFLAVVIFSMVFGIGTLQMIGAVREPIVLLGFSLTLLLLSVSHLFLIIAALLNLKLYEFLAKNNGMLFAIQAIPIHLLYYFYGSLTFVFFYISNKMILPNPENHKY